jgi:DNA-binding PadR family transcriptional regulator
MLEFAILGLLKERSMHGYDLRRHLRDDFGVLANLSFGSLYPALSRLEGTGAIRSIGQGPESAGESVLLTGSLGGERAATVARRATQRVKTLSHSSTRARKVYEITAEGEALFEKLLETPSATEASRSFSLRLAFARYLSPTQRIRLLERQRMELVDRLQRSSDHLAQPARALDTYERSLAEHARDAVENDLAWIERLLERERTLADRESQTSRVVSPESDLSTKDTTVLGTSHTAISGQNFAHEGGITQ